MSLISEQPVDSSQVITPTPGAATTVISNAPCYMRSLMLTVTSAAAATLVAYDNASAGSGTKLATLALPATNGNFLQLDFGRAGLQCVNGITIVTTGATATPIITIKK